MQKNREDKRKQVQTVEAAVEDLVAQVALNDAAAKKSTTAKNKAARSAASEPLGASWKDQETQPYRKAAAAQAAETGTSVTSQLRPTKQDPATDHHTGEADAEGLTVEDWTKRLLGLPNWQGKPRSVTSNAWGKHKHAVKKRMNDGEANPPGKKAKR